MEGVLFYGVIVAACVAVIGGLLWWSLERNEKVNVPDDRDETDEAGA
jgi:H+/gluconate symporter-like permease